LAQAEAALDAETLTGLLAAPTPAQLHLYLPKFKVRAKAELDPALRGLGVHTMYTDDADFSGISTTRLAVDRVLHEAVLTVDEQGLEGAAATAVVFRALSMARTVTRPIEVRVDRPFLFLVRHRPSGAVYFLARVVAP
jgi:serpin B